MRDIGWSQFFKLVEPKFEAQNCKVRKAIYQELCLLAEKDGGSWEEFSEAAKEEVPVNWATSGTSLKDSFRRGAGSKKIAAAIHYWFHTTRGLKSYAWSVDDVVFGDKLENTRPDLKIRATRDFFPQFRAESEGQVAPMNAVGLLPAHELEDIRAVLKASKTGECRALTLAQMTIWIEDIMQMKGALFPGSDEPQIFRTCFVKYEDWIVEDDIDLKTDAIVTWETKFRRPLDRQKFSIQVDGSYFVLIKRNGIRVSTGALHALNSWFSTLYQLLHDRVLEPRDIDMFLRYLMIFMICKRSEFLKFYFRDEGAKIDFVLRTAIDRAIRINLKLHNFTPLDDEYQQYLALQSR